MMFEAAIGTYLAIMMLCLYLGLRRVAGYAVVFDILVFVLCCWMFMGTYAGMMTGIIAGLFFSVTMHIIRRIFGYQVIGMKREKGKLVPEFTWKDVAP